MSAGKADGSSVLHHFVDEAGDPTLFDKQGGLIIGNGGCSRYFMLGKLEIEGPGELSRDLNAQRDGLLADPYFKNVPSMQPKNRKTALAFHAKDDIPEVRKEVYGILLKKNLRFYAVVRDKRNLAACVRQQNERGSGYRSRQDEQ